MNIHIQDPKVSLNNFDLVVAPEHDGLSGKNVIITKGAIHYLGIDELRENENYLKPRITKKNVVSFIIGGPNKYYDYSKEHIDNIFLKVKRSFIDRGFQMILIPSMRTPAKVIERAKEYFDKDQIIIEDIDKKAYLSSLKLAGYIIVTCDSTSMISEAAITGKPIYVAQMPSVKKNKRFQNFFNQFGSLNIIKDLSNTIENWQYEKLDETNKISSYIKERFKEYDFS